MTRFAAGDDVYGELTHGAYAEYAVADEGALARKPATLDFPEAAAVPLACVTALQGLRDSGGVTAGTRLLVNGASGGVGTFAVQIGKALGAHVTGVCSARNAELVRSAGADEVVDYARTDFTRGEQRYDVVFDLVGNHSMTAYRRVLDRRGVYVSSSGMPGGPVLGPVPYLVGVALSGLRGRPRMRVLVVKSTVEDLETIARMVVAGEITPVITRTRTLAELPEALAAQGNGHARGKTVITV
ncbi:NAD(P)-dependent alcohol dehydrogenase [Actinokineospora soli]|uniref:NAD(P)-dependent alcohol dehydrogenase n=1 Tax=Actinokineospora soli TaxID=1048753 RepID=A0ABW2TQD3_9PSEU